MTNPEGAGRNEKIIKNIKSLGFPWETNDPFLFCVHHLDHFPKGNDRLGPAASLEDRNIGQDFTIKDGWRMYNGDTVPGFPAHPHRGFETVTIVLDGFVDHSDSDGAAGRYGMGDVQWMSAGSGLQHAEMFPLLNQDKPNRGEIFQIWLNLPAAKKFVTPYYKMLWSEDIPKVNFLNKQNKKTTITIVAGDLAENKAVSPAPDSWAANPENEVAIWIIEMEAGASWTLPAGSKEVQRNLYFFEGSWLDIEGSQIDSYKNIELNSEYPIHLQSGIENIRMLFLQAKPIGEPVVQYGPFVMNSQQEIYEAYTDFRKDQFGGWPWPRHDPVHPRDIGRFARYADGSEEKPDSPVQITDRK
ncbi:MAG: pirin family protein [Anaerolineaceae bacterium]|nr:pirin family protein [Anaerolineaceae bacterium]